jgi:carbon storage regulator
MLVLTRHVGEAIVIGSDIRIMVTGVHGGKVRLGISAPPEVAIDRKEIHDRKTDFNVPTESELALVGIGCNLPEEPFSWPPIDLGGSD